MQRLVKRSSVKKHILFVDDDPHLLQGLRRMLRPMRQEWQMNFAASGSEALALLAHTPCDVVISDMRMPGMDGAQLLQEVRHHYPDTARIILSGHSDRTMILRSVGPTHQFLAKPCDAETLKATVARACSLRELLADTILTGLVAGIDSLPSLPSLYEEIIKAVQAPDGSLEHIGKIIECDMGMTAKMMQLTHSAFFGLPRQVSSPVAAVDLLGFDTVQTLVLSAHVFANFDQSMLQGLHLDTLWHHSMAVAVCAKAIAQAEGCDVTTLEDTFTAGLLHDVGKLVLAAHLPDSYGHAQELALNAGLEMWQAEHAILGASHAEVGAYLLGLWGLPDCIVDALIYHHCPGHSSGSSFSPLLAVHVANVLVHEPHTPTTAPLPIGLDLAYLDQLGLGAKLTDWHTACQQALQAKGLLDAPHLATDRHISNGTTKGQEA